MLARRSRRGFGDMAAQAPQALRSLVRADEIWLVVLAALLGIVAGLLVVAMNQTSQLAHELLYGLAPGERLSAQASLPAWRALLVPSVGGLCMGCLTLGLARWVPRRTVDPIEANALYGGKMSMKDSLIVVAQTLLSNGVGASVGAGGGLHADRGCRVLPRREPVPGAAGGSAHAGGLRGRGAPSPARSTRR